VLSSMKYHNAVLTFAALPRIESIILIVTFATLLSRIPVMQTAERIASEYIM